MTRRRSPVRLVVALSIAGILAVFILYTSLASGARPSLRPSQLAGHQGEVSLAGMVLGPVRGDSRGAGMRFTLRDIDGTARVAVVYRGSVPDLFKVGRHVFMRGELHHSAFVAVPDSLVTQCPSKYSPKRNSS